MCIFILLLLPVQAAFFLIYHPVLIFAQANVLHLIAFLG